MAHRVSKELLDLYDRYDGDLGLLDERWSSKQDRSAFSREQMATLGEYVDQLNFFLVGSLSPELRSRTEAKLQDLEAFIEPEVIQILKARAASSDQC